MAENPPSPLQETAAAVNHAGAVLRRAADALAGLKSWTVGRFTLSHSGRQDQFRLDPYLFADLRDSAHYVVVDVETQYLGGGVLVMQYLRIDGRFRIEVDRRWYAPEFYSRAAATFLGAESTAAQR